MSLINFATCRQKQSIYHVPYFDRQGRKQRALCLKLMFRRILFVMDDDPIPLNMRSQVRTYANISGEITLAISASYRLHL